MKYEYRELPDVMKKIRDYLDENATGKNWKRANTILQVYMDNPKEFEDMQVYVKGHSPYSSWEIGSDTIFRRGVCRITDSIEMSTKDWEHLKEMEDKNDVGVFSWFYRANTITKFIDFIYEVWCT